MATKQTVTKTRQGPRPCIICGKLAVIQFEDDLNGTISQAIWDWDMEGKGLLQDIPVLTPAQREVLLSGIHDACFEAMADEANQADARRRSGGRDDA